MSDGSPGSFSFSGGSLSAHFHSSGSLIPLNAGWKAFRTHIDPTSAFRFHSPSKDGAPSSVRGARIQSKRSRLSEKKEDRRIMITVERTSRAREIRQRPRWILRFRRCGIRPTRSPSQVSEMDRTEAILLFLRADRRERYTSQESVFHRKNGKD